MYNRSALAMFHAFEVVVARTLSAFLVWFSLPFTLAVVPASAPEAKPLAKAIDAIIDAPQYQHANWGILVVDAKSGETVYARNPDKLLSPASVTKLFTCAAALVTIGPDTTYETQVYRYGVLAEGTLRGDLVILAGGDLTLGGRNNSSAHLAFKDHDHTYANSGLAVCEVTDTDPLAGLNALAKKVKAAGINRVKGDVLVDDRLFSNAFNTGSGPEMVTSIMVNDNALDIIIEPGAKPGMPAKVSMRPQTDYYQIDAFVTTSEAGTEPAVRLVPGGPTKFAIRGSVPPGKPVLRIAPIHNPSFFVRALFIEALRRNGVQADAILTHSEDASLPPQTWYREAPLVASFTSPTLREVVRVTLKASHNVYATALPCLLAVKADRHSLESGLRLEGAALKNLGLDRGTFSFSSGAGGSNADKATPRAVVQLMQSMAKRPEWDAFKDSLPILGVDGTLVDAVGPQSPARGKVFAKTGTLAHYDATNERILILSKALGGTMTTKNGTALHFAFIVNDVALAPGASPQEQGKALGRLCEVLYTDGP